jgi:hypothetical protein
MAMSLETSECSGDASLGIRVQSLALNVAGRPDPGATASPGGASVYRVVRG